MAPAGISEAAHAIDSVTELQRLLTQLAGDIERLDRSLRSAEEEAERLKRLLRCWKNIEKSNAARWKVKLRREQRLREEERGRARRRGWNGPLKTDGSKEDAPPVETENDAPDHVVVGSRVLVYWDKEVAYFAGTVTERRKGSKFVIHYDDGDEGEFDLEEDEILVIDKRKSTATAAAAAEEGAHERNDGSRKRSHNAAVKEEDDEMAGEISDCNEKKMRNASLWKNSQSEAEGEETAAESDCAELLDDETVRVCNTEVPRPIRELVDSLQLPRSAHGSGLAGIDEMKPSLLPRRFKDVILLMDFLFTPSPEDGSTYHQRLYIEADDKSRKKPGIYTRAKLRREKERNPTNPAISWHRKMSKWVPPDKESLKAFIQFLTKIDLYDRGSTEDWSSYAISLHKGI